MAGNRRIVDRFGKRLPVNEDGTVFRSHSASTGRVSGYVGNAISSLGYYAVKALFFVICLAEGFLLASLLGSFHGFLFGESITGLKGTIAAFYPFISLVVTAGKGCLYVIRQVDRDGWTMVFFSPLIGLLWFVISLILFLLCNWSLGAWWSSILFVIALFVVLPAISGSN